MVSASPALQPYLLLRCLAMITAINLRGVRESGLAFPVPTYPFIASMLAVLAIGGITDHPIPLFAVGAFLAFTLSQVGMVVHCRRVGGPHATQAIAIKVYLMLRGFRRIVVICFPWYLSDGVYEGLLQVKSEIGDRPGPRVQPFPKA